MKRITTFLILSGIGMLATSCSTDVTDPETSKTYKEYATDDGFTPITPPPPPPPPDGGYTKP